jgi:hypothetical protein
VKNFARCSSAQKGPVAGVPKNSDRAVAVSSRATGFESGNLKSGPGRPGPDHLEYIVMFDCETPWFFGSLAGESFASILESHPRYPRLRRHRHRELFKILDDIVARNVSRQMLIALGFDDVGVAAYRAAALSAFRAARPTT